MGAINFFNSLEHLEPRCPKCETKIEYGITTNFDDKTNCHVCNNCGTEIR